MVVPVGADTVAVDLAVKDATRVVVWGISQGIAGKTPVETSAVVVETLAIHVAELATWQEFAQARERQVLVLATSVEALDIWLVTVIVEEEEVVAEAAEVVASVLHAARKVTLQGTALRLLDKNKKSDVHKLLCFLLVF